MDIALVRNYNILKTIIVIYFSGLLLIIMKCFSILWISSKIMLF